MPPRSEVAAGSGVGPSSLGVGTYPQPLFKLESSALRDLTMQQSGGAGAPQPGGAAAEVAVSPKVITP